MSELVSKSWFCVLNNPEEHGFSGSPQEIVDTCYDDLVSLASDIPVVLEQINF